MSSPYHSAFLIPRGANKTLGDGGWDITSDDRIPPSILDALKRGLGIKYVETYLGIEVYQRETMKADVTYDDQGQIEFIYFQVFDGEAITISNVLEQAGLLNKVELFVPTNKPGPKFDQIE